MLLSSQACTSHACPAACLHTHTEGHWFLVRRAGFTRALSHTNIHAYIHTHIHTHIHTYIRTCTQCREYSVACGLVPCIATDAELSPQEQAVLDLLQQPAEDSHPDACATCAQITLALADCRYAGAMCMFYVRQQTQLTLKHDFFPEF
jgi:hypothetical protein